MQRPTQLISLVQIRYFFVVVQGKYVIMLWRGGINRINTILGLVDVPKSLQKVGTKSHKNDVITKGVPKSVVKRSG